MLDPIVICLDSIEKVYHEFITLCSLFSIFVADSLCGLRFIEVSILNAIVYIWIQLRRNLSHKTSFSINKELSRLLTSLVLILLPRHK